MVRHLDRTAMGGDDRAADAETKAKPFGTRGEKSRRIAGQYISDRCRSVVGNIDPDCIVLPACIDPDLRPQRAGMTVDLDRVHQQVYENLLQLNPVGSDGQICA